MLCGEGYVSNSRTAIAFRSLSRILFTSWSLASHSSRRSSSVAKASARLSQVRADLAAKLGDFSLVASWLTDGVPVAKTARRAGIHFIIDPMGHNVSDELVQQVDGIEDLSRR